MEVKIADCSTLNPVQLEAWVRLFESVPDARFYHHPHWMQCVNEHLTANSLQIVFVSVEKQLQMVVPLDRSKSPRRRYHPAHDHLSLNDILIHPDLCNQPEKLFDYLNAALCVGGENWTNWKIANVPHFSPLINALASCNQSSVTIDETVSAPSLRTERDSANDHWMLKKTRESASFDCTSDDRPPHGKLRRNLRRLRKQLQDTNEVRVENAVEPDQLQAAFEHFLTTENSGWKGNGLEATAIANNPELRAFYGALLKPAIRGISAEINLLWSGTDCTAAQFGLRTGKCLSLLKIGYNESFSRFSPGYLLLESILDGATERNIETLSLVTSPPWADRWHPDTSTVWQLNRYNNSTLGSAQHQMDKLKQLAKSRLRAPA